MNKSEYFIIINEGKYVAFAGDILMILTQIGLFYFAIHFDNSAWTLVSILMFFIFFAIKIRLSGGIVIRCKDEQDAIGKLQDKIVDKSLKSF